MLWLAVLCPSLFAQNGSGELRLTVTDTDGAVLAAHGVLTNQAAHFELSFDCAGSGEYAAKELPLGTYHLTLSHPGFAPSNTLVEVRSQLPQKFTVALTVAAVPQSVSVADSDTLLDVTNPGNIYELGGTALREWPSGTLGRQAIDVVSSQPGWTLEANGVLHPRGSEYDTQYVEDGLPMLNNRSPAFSPTEDIEETQSVKIYTSGIPAEFGRKVGGIIETVSDRNPAHGLHGSIVAGGGSFNTEDASVNATYSAGHNVFGLSASGGHTDRFLDPPVTENFTNSATLAGIKGTFERDLNQRDRLRLALNFNRSGLSVPNNLLQQQNAQREDRSNREVSGQVSYQHTFSANLLGTVQARGRDDEADLVSNALSTPIQPFQDRGFRESYVSASLAASLAHHEIKIGADSIYSQVHERFSYQITATELNGQPIFDPSTPLDFSFHQSADDREQAFFLQDNAHFGNLNLSGGIRFDHYDFRVTDSGWSPRFGFAWYIPKLGVVLRGSYDRAFGTPATENLLASTSAKVRTLNRDVAQLALRPSRGNYYELGMTKGLFQRAHLSGNLFRRDIRNFGDDNVLLNTGISFPIALSSAHIYGAESQLGFSKWGKLSGWVNYSYMVASARLPAVGGLFLGEDVAQLLNSNDRVWVSQDQRHAVNGQLRFEPWSRFWIAPAIFYGSGLPAELNGLAVQSLTDLYGTAVLDRVNVAAERVRPTLSVDLSSSVTLYDKEGKSVRVQADFKNLNDRLNLINFASVFSGTAIGVPRSLLVHLRVGF